MASASGRTPGELLPGLHLSVNTIAYCRFLLRSCYLFHGRDGIKFDVCGAGIVETWSSVFRFCHPLFPIPSKLFPLSHSPLMFPRVPHSSFTDFVLRRETFLFPHWIRSSPCWFSDLDKQYLRFSFVCSLFAFLWGLYNKSPSSIFLFNPLG